MFNNKEDVLLQYIMLKKKYFLPDCIDIFWKTIGKNFRDLRNMANDDKISIIEAIKNEYIELSHQDINGVAKFVKPDFFLSVFSERKESSPNIIIFVNKYTMFFNDYIPTSIYWEKEHKVDMSMLPKKVENFIKEITFIHQG